MPYLNSIERLERRTFLAAGQLDPTFGDGGVVVTELDIDVVDHEQPVAVLPQANGKVIVVAEAIDMPITNNQPHRAVLLRYNADGSLDSSFGGDGIVIDDFPEWESYWPQDAVHLGDGSILVYARLNRQFNPNDPDAPTQVFATVRYSSSGVVTGEPAIIPTGERRDYIEIGDGRVIVVGNSINNTPFDDNDDFAFVSRINANGAIDNSFGTNGRFILPNGFEDGFGTRVLDIRTDGRIVVGLRGDIVQLNPNGTIDTTFGGGDGIHSLPPSEWTYASVAAAADGGFYATAWKVGNKVQPPAIVKLKADGSVDPNFINGTFDGGFLGGKIYVQPDGKLISLASSIQRFNANGTRDVTFGNNGLVNPNSILNGFLVSGIQPITTPAGIFGIGNYAGKLATFRLENNPTAGGGNSSVVIVEPNAHGLNIVGTPGDDMITFDVQGTSLIVTANGVVHTVAVPGKQVSIVGGAGNDYIDLRDLGAIGSVDVPVTIEGGDGDDVLVGHAGGDRITGGNGADRINGWSGDDVLSGNAQGDRIDGGTGDDHVLGNGGRDRLGGNIGDDLVQGGDQPDVLFGHAGNDTLLGEGSHDRLDGGAGRDSMSGAGGNDRFFARDSEIDDIVGGLLGDDRAEADDVDTSVGIEAFLG